jgi:hypothetical protein
MWPEALCCPCRYKRRVACPSIDESDKIIEKYRLSYDLSLPGPSGFLVNKHVIDHFCPLVCLASRYSGWCKILLAVGHTTRARGQDDIDGQVQHEDGLPSGPFAISQSGRVLGTTGRPVVYDAMFPLGGGIALHNGVKYHNPFAILLTN